MTSNRDIPALNFRVYPEIGDPYDVRYALVWNKAGGARPRSAAPHIAGAGLPMAAARQPKE